MADGVTDALISARIREAREYLDLSIQELADVLGVPLLDAEALESGLTPIGAARLAQVAKALGRGLEFFTGAVPPAAATERADFLARAAETLSEQDMGELRRFATYLVSRSEGQPA